MKLTLTADMVSIMTLSANAFPGLAFKDWPEATKAAQSKEAAEAKAAKTKWTPKANYLVYDQHRDAPVGFGIRVGKKASTFLVEPSSLAPQAATRAPDGKAWPPQPASEPVGPARKRSIAPLPTARYFGRAHMSTRRRYIACAQR